MVRDLTASLIFVAPHRQHFSGIRRLSVSFEADRFLCRQRSMANADGLRAAASRFLIGQITISSRIRVQQAGNRGGSE
jgi:hypothetical protein